MKLTDLDKDYVAEAPVGLLKTAATKLKKRIPLAPGIRARAEGEDITNKAANQLAIAFLRWSGQTKKDLNAITPQDLMTFFKNEGYAKTAKDIVKQAVDQKTPKPEPEKVEVKGTQQAQEPQPQKPKKRRASEVVGAQAKKAAEQPATESLEYRLNEFLGEDADSSVTFNKKEVEKIILAVVAKVAEIKPKELAQKVEAEPEPEETQAEPSEQVTAMETHLENFARALADKIQSHGDIPDDAKRDLIQTMVDLANQLEN